MADRYDWLPPELKSPVDAYCQEMAKLLANIHRLSANALGLPENFFDELYKEPMNSLKLSNYLSPLAEMDKDANATSANAPLLYGAHKDILVLLKFKTELILNKRPLILLQKVFSQKRISFIPFEINNFV
jgi:isopenicillin N synthase-like dioxygenase